LGLAFLVLIHEAGHFFTALWVGMRPRKFYLGFPPPIVKTRRRGVEYGIGAIPLGGYVKIPGMHRPAAGDLDYRLQNAVRSSPAAARPLEAVKRPLANGDYDAAGVALHDLDGAMRDAGQPTDLLTDTRDALASDAYWRQRTWRKVLVIFAGPGANVLFALLIFTVLFMVGGGKATSTINEVVAGTPAAHMGLRSGDRILSIDGRPVRSASSIPRAISHSGGRPVTLVVRRSDGTVVKLGPVRPEKMEGVYRLGFVLEGRGLSLPAAARE